MFKPLGVPIRVSLALTNRCNLNCKYCSVNPCRKDYDKDLTTQEWSDFIDYMVKVKVLKVYLTGGEPFVREDIYDIIEYLMARPLWIDGINTNGTLIDEAGARRLGAYKKKIKFSVSLDGSSPDIHDEVRGTGTFNKTVEGIRNLIKYNNHVVTYTTITKHNMDDLENILKLGKELGISSMKFNPVIIIGNAIDNEEEVGLTKDDMRKIMHIVPYLREKYESFNGILQDMHEMATRREEEIVGVKEDAPIKTFIGCKMGLSNCVVRGDGWVLPCDRLWDMKAGNIRENDFLDIWRNSSVFQDIRKKFSVTIDILDECKNCEFNKICTGGCPATMYDITGDIWGYDHISCYKFITECIS